MAVWHTRAARGTVAWRCGVAGMLVSMFVAVLAGCGSPTGTGRAGGGTPLPTQSVIPPTYTANPLTPTPTTEEQRLDTLVWQAIGVGAVQVQTTYRAADGTTDVEITYGAVVPIKGIVPTQNADIAAAQERVKTICFEVEKALWTSGTSPLSQVSVAVLGPVLDQYANLTSQAYGSVVLKGATAAHFAWSTLTPDVAWDKYDSNYLRADYSDVN
jgi:hypothetical protein